MVMLTSCLPMGTKTNLHFKKNPSFEAEVVPDLVTFAFLKRKILAPQCISCHKEMANENELNKWWVVEGNVEESDLYVWMKDGDMPPDRAATTYELEIVRRYIEQTIRDN